MNSSLKLLLWSAGVAVVTSGCGSGMQGPQPVQPAAPTISALPDQVVPQDTTTADLSFAIGDADSDVSQVVVSARSADTSLVPAEGLALGGSGASRTIRLTPAEDAKGTALITLRAVDPSGLSSERSFNLVINAVSASFRSSTNVAYAAHEGEAPQAVSGVSFNADVDDDPMAFDTQLQ